MFVAKNVKSLKIELDKKRSVEDRRKFYKGYKFKILPQFTVPINLYLDNQKYFIPGDNTGTYTSDAMFFASIPNKRQFDLIKQKEEEYEVEMVDGNFRLYLTFRNNGEDVDIRIDLVFEGEPSYLTMKTSDLFTQFDQMWIDLVDVLYEVYPKDLVDQEMNKIYQQIDERIAKGNV